jgi:hypothetical protein
VTVSAAHARVLEALPEAAQGRITVYRLDAQGGVRHRIGVDDGARFAVKDGGAQLLGPPDRRAVGFRWEGEPAALTFPREEGTVLADWLRELLLLAGSVTRLEHDLESMESRSALLLEEVSLVSDTLPKLPTGDSEYEICEMALKTLVVAAGVERAVYVRYDGERNLAEVSVHVAMLGEAREALPEPYPRELVFDAGTGVVGAALRGNDGGILANAPAAPLRPGLAGPEALARRQLIAVPVRYGTGSNARTLGVIVVMDRRSSSFAGGRELSNEERALTAAVACMLGSVLGTRYAAEMRKELATANEIQEQIRPEGQVRVAGFDLAGECRTCGEVGGDYFDFLTLAGGRTLAVLADVSGHNLASGMLMVSARAALRALAPRYKQVERIFDELDGALFDDLVRTEKFVTAVGVALAPGSRRVRLVNAGHCPTLVFRAQQGSLESIASTSPILGFRGRSRHRSKTIELAVGDVMLLYTDGISESTNDAEEMFGEERLQDELRAAATGSAAAILETILAAVERFRGNRRALDDVSAVVIKAVAPTPARAGGAWS